MSKDFEGSAQKKLDNFSRVRLKVYAMASTTFSNFIPPEKQKTYFGHPAGLFVLFFTEMWERFSYYGMRALLILYMTSYLIKDPARTAQVFGFDSLRHILEMGFGPMGTQPLASQIYGLYTGFVYLSPFFGGILADKVWGQRKTVYIGAVLMAIGHFLMAMESMFLLALFFLILGNGAFKPNISTQVGNLYPMGDPRRDGAFTIFYMGINLGSIFSPLVCGTLGQTVGWDWGFGAAGVGMVVGLAVYHFGRKYLPLDKQQLMEAEGIKTENKGGAFATKTILAFFASVVVFFFILVLPAALKILIGAIVVGGICYVISRLEKDDRARVIALSLICLGAIAFWTIYEQQGNTLQLWADEKTNWTFFGWQVPSTWYQMFNPAMIFIFAPLLDMVWSARAKKGKTSTSVRKMGIGCILCGLAFIVMIIAAKSVGSGAEKGSLLWLALNTWIFTMGELYLSPIGLSLFTKVAPAKMLSMMMGAWLMSSFFGNYMSGYVGTFYDKMPKDSFFLMLCIIGVVVGIFFLAAEGKMKKLIGDV
jgi:POT family proton-dependent oligopeptide transporter